jgi:hypothetical protein
MPYATGIREALGEATFPEKVDAMRQVAARLAVLVERFGLNHRDVKLPNLYWWRGQVAVGDFGLARRPEDSDLSGDRPVGPFHHLPSEVLIGEAEIDWERVDVHCVANSLWQLVAVTRYPPRGHIAAEGEYDLARRSDDEQAHQLALLIDGATNESAAARPTLLVLAQQLGDLLASREISDVIQSEHERMRRNSNEVLRWLVAHVRANPVFDGVGWEMSDAQAPSGIARLNDDEVGEALEELTERGLIYANRQPRMGGRTDWTRLYPTLLGIQAVEDIDVLLARATPILRDLMTSRELLSLDSYTERVEFGEVSFPMSEGYFLFQLVLSLGFVSYGNVTERNPGGVYLNVKTTASGRDWLVAHYA